MPDFLTAYRKTLGFEGGWSNLPDDRGGETVMGISRRNHPAWPGWPLVDSLKNEQGIPNLNQAAALPLSSLVESFYQAEYWERAWCGKLPAQGLAEEIFDSAVNCGVDTAVAWLQEMSNLLRQKDDALLAVDGAMGERTLAALNILAARNNLARLTKLLNIVQAAHYLALVRYDPGQRQFLIGGWLNRVTL